MTTKSSKGVTVRRVKRGRRPIRMQRSLDEYRMQAVRSGHIDFTELARRLKCDETEAEARYEQWLTESGLRELDHFFGQLWVSREDSADDR